MDHERNSLSDILEQLFRGEPGGQGPAQSYPWGRCRSSGGRDRDSFRVAPGTTVVPSGELASGGVELDRTLTQTE